MKELITEFQDSLYDLDDYISGLSLTDNEHTEFTAKVNKLYSILAALQEVFNE